jgi:hypothetical protein
MAFRSISSLLALLGAFLPMGAAQQVEPQPGTLDLCTVAGNIRAYAGHPVRVTGFLAVGAESVVLYDPKCQDGKLLVWVEFNPKAQETRGQTARFLRKSACPPIISFYGRDGARGCRRCGARPSSSAG